MTFFCNDVVSMEVSFSEAISSENTHGFQCNDSENDVSLLVNSSGSSFIPNSVHNDQPTPDS